MKSAFPSLVAVVRLTTVFSMIKMLYLAGTVYSNKHQVRKGVNYYCWLLRCQDLLREIIVLFSYVIMLLFTGLVKADNF